MRLHKNLVISVIEALKLIFIEGQYADKVVERVLRSNKKWGARDRKFVAETIYDIVRWKRLYSHVTGVNDHYTQENLWRLIGIWIIDHKLELPKWNAFEATPVRRLRGNLDEARANRALRESIPDWMDKMGAKELGEKVWTKEITAQNQRAEVILRANTLRTNALKLKEILAKEEIVADVVKGYPYAVKLTERKNVFRTQAFKDGLFEVQDASSQLVADMLDIKPGMRIIDTCAGAGGKTLHLAALSQNKGQIIAMDIYGHKLLELKKRARRDGAHNIDTRVIDSTKVIKKLKESADRVLIDAPCSGLGVLKRNPGSKWKLQPEFIDNIRKTQAEILDSYSSMVKPGGKLVYATCSVLPSENEKQVEAFLKNHEEFTLVKDRKVLAHETGFDGFYMALLEKKSK